MDKINVNGNIIKYEVKKDNNTYKVLIDGKSMDINIHEYGDYFWINTNNGNFLADVYKTNDYTMVWIDDEFFLLKEENESTEVGVEDAEKLIKSPMPGIIREIKVKENDCVKRGDSVFILESMKVLNELKSLSDGVVKKIFVNQGDQVSAFELLAEIEYKESTMNFNPTKKDQKSQ